MSYKGGYRLAVATRYACSLPLARRYAAYTALTSTAILPTARARPLPPSTTDPETNTAYIAITRIDKAMLKADPMDGLGPDHFQLAPNPCGVIMSLKLDDSYKATQAQVHMPSCTLLCLRAEVAARVSLDILP